MAFININKLYQIFTSESVSEGHPDKICDQISDSILDEILKNDPNGRVACEVLVSQNKIIIAGEITTIAKVNYDKVARNVLKDIGYDDDEKGIDYKTCDIQVILNEQSPEISEGVDRDGAGDQGIMFGFAINNKLANYLPLPISIAHELVKKASKLRKNKEFLFALPDMKSEVTINYKNLQKPKIDHILFSVQHTPDFNKTAFNKYIYEKIMIPVALQFNLNTDFKYLINPCGPFTIGGPKGDTGLTGRKIIVDTYGGMARHGGGCFSGKDSSKIDRTGAYMARYIAKNIVASGLADECEIQLAYAIGVKTPISVSINTFNTEKIAKANILKAIKNHFDLTPKGMINTLNLKQPIFRQASVYGHFGRPHHELPWENLDIVDKLKTYLKK